jgi:bifunctional isochorismate lyase/aryl carrier protein
MKKNEYFSKETIFQKSTQMLTIIREMDLIHSGMNFQFKNAALLVLDMQKYFLKPQSHAFIPSAPAIISNILSLINSFVMHDQPIFFTRHTNCSATAGMMSVWWKDLIKSDSELSSIISEIDLSKGIIINKERYDAFWNTSLGEMLIKRNIRQVVICGVMTHLCCETTARSAFVRDYHVFFAIDGTATYLEQFHLSTLINLSHGFAKPILCTDILDL